MDIDRDRHRNDTDMNPEEGDPKVQWLVKFKKLLIFNSIIIILYF